MKATPSPECPQARKPHPEHVFRVFGTMTIMDGAHVDCPGKDA